MRYMSTLGPMMDLIQRQQKNTNSRFDSHFKTLLLHIHNAFKQTRHDLEQQEHSLLDAEYCQRIAFLFFNVASLLNDSFTHIKTDLQLVQIYIEKCLDWIKEIPDECNVRSQQQISTLPQSAFKTAGEVKLLSEEISRMKLQETGSMLGPLLPTAFNPNEPNPAFANMVLIHTIIEFKESITIKRSSRKWSTFENTTNLATLYEVFGLSDIAAAYFASAEMAVGTEPKPTIQTDWESILQDELQHGKSFSAIWSILQNVHPQTTFADKQIVSKAFTKEATIVWLKNCESVLNDMRTRNQTEELETLLKSLLELADIFEIPTAFQVIPPFPSLVEQLEDHHQLLVPKFKQLCSTSLVEYSVQGEAELSFLNALVQALNSIMDVDSISCMLDLKDFCDDRISFKELVCNTLKLDTTCGIPNTELTELKTSAERLQVNQRPFLLLHFIRVLETYLDPVKLIPKQQDMKKIIEVSGRRIVLSKILPKLMPLLQADVEEVRFVGAEVFHVNEDLRGEDWKGKNIAIVANEIRVVGQVVWNVSGRNGKEKPASNSTTVGLDGKDGEDGGAGESGGNVLVLAQKVADGNRWTIISNGGNGAKGKGGGDGINGEDGKGMTASIFRDKFPAVTDFPLVTLISPVLLLCPINFKLDKLRSVIRTMLDLIPERNMKVSVIDCKTASRSEVGNLGRYFTDVYLEGETHDGMYITFSAYSGICHGDAFVLCEGSKGEPGGRAGECGLGGEVGYKGQIIIPSDSNINREKRNGDVGCNGENGRHGLPGENGWDIGYVDFYTWSKEVRYGEDQRSRITMDKTEADKKHSVWCNYKSNRYVGLNSVPVQRQNVMEHNRQLNQNKSSRNRSMDAVATKKKNITEQSITNQTSAVFKDQVSSVTQQLRGTFRQIGDQAMSVVVNSQMQQTAKKSVAREFVKMRGYEKKARNLLKKENLEITSGLCNVERRREILLAALQGSIPSIQEWGIVQNVDTTCKDLSTILQLFRAEADSTISFLEPMLVDKYKFACLEAEATAMGSQPSRHSFTCDSFYESDDDSLFLIPITNDLALSGISNPILGTLQDFVDPCVTGFKQQAIANFFKDKHRANYSTLERCMSTFVVKTHTNASSKFVKGYYQQYMQFEERKSRKVSLIFDAFNTVISLPRNMDLHRMWTASVTDPRLKPIFMKNLMNDTLLQKMYNRLSSEVDASWELETSQLASIATEFQTALQELELGDKLFLSFVADAYDVNLRVYGRHQQTESYRLEDNFKCSQPNRVFLHVHVDGNSLRFLQVNAKFKDLHSSRMQQELCYEKILCIYLAPTSLQEVDELQKRVAKPEFELFKENVNVSVLTPESDCISKILERFPEEDRNSLATNIDKLQSKYCGRNLVLQLLHTRFECEGVHISSQELEFLLTTSFNHYACFGSLWTSSWILASSSQRHWTLEFVIFELETCILEEISNETKSQLRSLLGSFKERVVLMLMLVKVRKGPVTLKQLTEVLHLLARVTKFCTNELSLLEIQEWPYLLKQMFWSQILVGYGLKEEDNYFPLLVYYLLSIEDRHDHSLTLHLCTTMFQTQSTVLQMRDTLCEFHNGNWNLTDNVIKEIINCSNLDVWIKTKRGSQKESRTFDQLLDLIRDNKTTSEGVKCVLPLLMKSKLSVATKEMSQADIKTFCEVKIPSLSRETLSSYLQLMEVIDSAILLTKGFTLRPTQKLSVLLLLCPESSTLAQIATGEGKSLILVVAAVIQVLLNNNRTDIITSSSVLAKRDAKGSAELYSLFGIKVGHNCSEDMEERKDVYSSCQVVYGDLGSFQRDHLLHTFFPDNILGDKQLGQQVVFVDEVDNMLLDKGNNVLYLSHELPGLSNLKSLFLYLRSWVAKPVSVMQDSTDPFNTQAIKTAVERDLYGTVEASDISMISNDLTPAEVKVIKKSLVDQKIVGDNGRLLISKRVQVSSLKIPITRNNCNLTERVATLITQHVERPRQIAIPNYLLPCVDRHLEDWIQSFVTATFMDDKVDYVIDIDRSGTTPELLPNVISLDLDTGTDQHSYQWDKGLHQAIQLKHGCSLSPLSLKAVYISNVHYLQQYKRIHGVTGTIGSTRERDLLQRIYNVEFIHMPTSKPKRFQELEPICCDTFTSWITQITKTAVEVGKTRSVLIISESVENAQRIHKAFGDRSNVHLYIRDYEPFVVAMEDKGNRLECHSIIVATNLAGRGTDIQIGPSLEAAGGLHVLLTYLPRNDRIQEQAFGRSARAGTPGSGQLILITKSHLQFLKQQRNVAELSSIQEIEEYYNTVILQEENCLHKFHTVYKMLEKMLEKNHNAEIIATLLSTCIDKWAYWLDESSSLLRKHDDGSKWALDHKLSTFLADLKSLKAERVSHLLEWVQGHPYQMTKLAKCLIIKGRSCIVEADQLLTNVIEMEPDFSQESHYYKALAIGKNVNWQSRNVSKVTEVESALTSSKQAFGRRIHESYTEAGMVGRLQQSCKGLVQVNGFEQQQTGMISLLQIFENSINDIVGSDVTPDRLTIPGVDEPIATRKLFHSLLSTGKMAQPKCCSLNTKQREISDLAQGYMLSPDELEACLRQEWNSLEELKNVLKANLRIPTRQEFWKILCKQKILTNEISYVVVDKPKLEKIHSFALRHIEAQQCITSLDSIAEGEILLYPERLKLQTTQDLCVLEKSKLKNVLSSSPFVPNSYHVLKSLGVFSYNKKARLDTTKVEAELPKLFKISVADFARVSINKEEANLILEQLEVKGIIGKADGLNYVLKVSSQDVMQLDLEQSPVYNSVVKRLLLVSCSYAMGLDKVRENRDNLSSFQIPIKADVFSCIIWDMLDAGIIKGCRLLRDSDDYISFLSTLYPTATGEVEIRQYISEYCLVDGTTSLMVFEKLSQCNWIWGDPNIEYQYRIANKERWASGLNLPDGMEKTVRSMMQQWATLQEKSTQTSISTHLKRLQGTLLGLKVPNFQTKPVTKVMMGGEDGTRFRHISELRLLMVNGLDLVFACEEAKWTLEMFLNTFTVILLGIVQIAIGVAIEIFSAGLMTHVGGAFISEGINDLFFAATCLYTGYFSWQSYKEQKIQSLFITAATGGLGALLSRGAKVSRFGKKLIQPGVEIAGKSGTQLAGKELINSVGRGIILKEAGKRIGKKTVEGLAFGIANSGVDAMVETSLKSFTDGIVVSVLADVSKAVQEHREVARNLKLCFDRFGDQDTQCLVNNWTARSLSKSSNWKEFFSVANKIGSAISHGVSAASRKAGKYGGAVKVASYVQKSLVWTERVTHLGEAVFVTQKLLDSLNVELNRELESSTEATKHEQGDFDHFVHHVITKLEIIIVDNASQTLRKQAITPLLQSGATLMLRYAAKGIKGVYNNCQAVQHFDTLKETQQLYQSQMHKAESEHHGDASTLFSVKRHLTQKYYQTLKKLLLKTRNPSVFSAIVKEGVPLDISCASACVYMLHDYVKLQRFAGITIKIEGQDGLKATFSSNLGNAEKNVLISLKLDDGHYSSTTASSVAAPVESNDCLLAAICGSFEAGGIPLQIGGFREELCRFMESDRQFGNIVTQRWHQFGIRLGAFGGAEPTTWVLGEHDIDFADPNISKFRRQLYMQRQKAFNWALKKINEVLEKREHVRHGEEKKFKKLEPSNFKPTRYDQVKGKKGRTVLYPVEIEATINVNVLGPGGTRSATLVEHRVCINLDNPATGAMGPTVPHVGYDIIPRGKGKGGNITGHILLNKEGNEYIPTRVKCDQMRKYSNDPSYRELSPRTLFYETILRAGMKLIATDIQIAEVFYQITAMIEHNGTMQKLNIEVSRELPWNVGEATDGQ